MSLIKDMEKHGELTKDWLRCYNPDGTSFMFMENGERKGDEDLTKDWPIWYLIGLLVI